MRITALKKCTQESEYISTSLSNLSLLFVIFNKSKNIKKQVTLYQFLNAKCTCIQLSNTNLKILCNFCKNSLIKVFLNILISILIGEMIRSKYEPYTLDLFSLHPFVILLWGIFNHKHNKKTSNREPLQFCKLHLLRGRAGVWY